MFAITRIVLIGSLIVTVCSCAKIQLPEPLVEDIAKRRETREQEAFRQFEIRRNEAEYQAALSRWNAGDAIGCRTMLMSLLGRSPRHLSANLLLSDLLITEGAIDTARQRLESLVRDYPDDARVHHSQGLAMEIMGQEEIARRHFERAAQLQPNDPLFAVSRPNSNENDNNRLAKENGSTSWRKDLLNSAHTAAGQGLLLIAASRTRQTDALIHWEAAIQSEPDNQHIPIASCVYLIRLGRFKGAAILAETALHRFKASPSLLRILGTAQLLGGDFYQSQVACQQALSLDNSSALSYFLLGCTLLQLGQPDQAHWHFQQAQRLDPRFSEQRSS